MDNKILEMYPLTFTAEEARKLAKAIMPSALDRLFYKIYRNAAKGNTYIEWSYADMDDHIRAILYELGYKIVDNQDCLMIYWE